MKFECGCELNDDFFALPEVEQWEHINDNCDATWDMIGEGLTKGVFQLEKSLGRRWCRKIKPRTIGELADVISLIRPGCLEAEFRENPSNGKMLSITDTYVKIRSGEWSPEYIHDTLEPILNTTYGVPVYQEQIMKICEKFAGFSLVEADDARKAMGKKDAAKMDIVHKKFVKGAVANGNNEEMAEVIFSWIDKFSGYGFNKSHAVGYADLSYQTAYAKTHFPTEFFKSMLTFSSSKQDEFDEIKQLVHEARLFGISVNLPDARIGNKEFELTDDGQLRFGLAHIKNVGPSSIPTLKPLKKVSNEGELLACLFSDKTSIKKNVAEALIKSGALDYCIKNRVRTLGRFRMMGALTPRERKWVLERPEVLSSLSSVWLHMLIEAKVPRPMDSRVPRITDAWDVVKKELGGNRLKLSLSYEKFHLGMAVSGSEADLYYNEKVDTSCRNFLRLRSNSRVCMGVLIEEVRQITDKKGNPMCFMKISDSSYMLDGVVVFSRVFGKCGWIIEPGKAVMIKGKKQDTSLLVDSIEHL